MRKEYTPITVLKLKDPDGQQCPECPSTDGFKDQGNGWGHCFSCGANVQLDKRNTTFGVKAAVPAANKRPLIELGDRFVELPDRKISKATCEKYKVWREDGKDFFPCFKDRQHVGTKFRPLDNKRGQRWTGTQSELFGQHLFPAGCAKYITVTEGEYDAMSAYEMMGSRWPVVSVLNGTGSAVQDVKNNYEYLNSFDNIVLSFDADAPGEAAVKAVAAMFPMGKVRVMHHKRHKDANEYKLAGEGQAYTKEWWDSPKFMPDGLKLGTTLWEDISNRPKHFQVPYPFEGLNRLTYGIRLSEMVVITADTGIGKTSILKEIEYSLLMNEECKEKNYGVGFIHLEEPNYDTALGLLSVHNSKPYHLPDTERTVEELRTAYDAVVNTNRVVIWDHFGSNRVDAVLDKIRHMHALGCKYIVLDHLSIVVSDQSGDERKQLDEIATKAKTLCMELNMALLCVIHQNRTGQIRGTAGVEQLANIVIKMYRENTDRDEWRRNVTKLVVEKNRFSGRTGPACWLSYNGVTGRLSELSPEEVERYEEGGTIRDYEVAF